MLLSSNVGKENLADDDLDQSIIERACAVVILERWAEHVGYRDVITDFMNEIPKYTNLLKLDDMGLQYDLSGITLFLDGLSKYDINVSGFLYPSSSGYLMSHTSAINIKKHFEGTEHKDIVTLFDRMAVFFMGIYEAQMNLISALMKIQKWNKPSAVGFRHILTQCSDSGTQSWMLGSLYKVVDDPIVQSNIFQKYLAALQRTKDKYEEKGIDKSQIKQLDTIIEMVTDRSKGKS